MCMHVQVLDFNRYPEFVVHAVRSMHATPADHFYDDFMAADLPAGGDSARRSIEATVMALGPGSTRPAWMAIRSPELDPKKLKPLSSSNVVLGIQAELDGVCSAEPHVTFSPSPGRVERILDMFRSALRRGVLTPHEAASLRGKIFFCLSAAYGMVGRAATLPLVQRQYRDRSYGFYVGSELHHSMLFFEALLPRLPLLHVPLAPSTVPPLLVYTDASFWLQKRKRPASSNGCAAGVERLRRHERLRGALGAVVYDPVSGIVRHASALPPWDILLSSWRHDRKTYIAELEALAAISVYSTYPAVFAGRKVNHFIDNTVALSAFINGYSGKPELAKAVNVFYLQLVGLRATAYLEYVPSKANIADLPSRLQTEKFLEEMVGLDVRPLGAPDPMVVPSVGEWSGDLEYWLDNPLGVEAKLPI